MRGWRKPSKRQREESLERFAAYMKRLDRIRAEQVRKPAETDTSDRAPWGGGDSGVHR